MWKATEAQVRSDEIEKHVEKELNLSKLIHTEE
jgi:hypothetical protein